MGKAAPRSARCSCLGACRHCGLRPACGGVAALDRTAELIRVPDRFVLIDKD